MPSCSLKVHEAIDQPSTWKNPCCSPLPTGGDVTRLVDLAACASHLMYCVHQHRLNFVCALHGAPLARDGPRQVIAMTKEMLSEKDNKPLTQKKHLHIMFDGDYEYVTHVMSEKPFIVLQTQVCRHLGSNQRTYNQKCAMRYLEGGRLHMCRTSVQNLRRRKSATRQRQGMLPAQPHKTP